MASIPPACARESGAEVTDSITRAANVSRLLQGFCMSWPIQYIIIPDQPLIILPLFFFLFASWARIHRTEKMLSNEEQHFEP
jgi:hypothetical protein